MSRMGIGYREMRQYRKLPDDDKTALLEVAKSGDKEAFIDLAESLVAKHAKEKEALNTKVANLEADQKATEKVLTEKNKKLDQVQTSLEKLQLRTAPWDERVALFKEEITQRQSIIDEAVARHLQAVDALDAWTNAELTLQPDYDPENGAAMPTEVLTVLLHLSDAVERTATLVANAQHELRMRFGGYIDEARQQLLAA
jgi:chromosome segregation ATPase